MARDGLSEADARQRPPRKCPSTTSARADYVIDTSNSEADRRQIDEVAAKIKAPLRR